ncbi:MAG: O-antigen ligase family protein, partial [Bacteroidales bacterium]|nr:O-antigen ligase family protein [Bacteroidales bacterium]
LIYYQIFYLPLLPILLIIAWIAFSRIDRFIYLIVFFVPLSIPLTEFMEDLPFDLFIPTEPFLAGVMILYFLKYFNGQRIDMRILRHPVTLAIYFNIAWIFVTSITSSMPLVSVKFLVARMWFIISFYLLLSQIFQDPKRIRQYLWAYIIPFSMIIVYVLIRHSAYGLNNQMASHWVVKPFYNDHTSYGAVLAMLLPALLGMYFSYRKLIGWQRIMFILLLLFYFAATLFSYTRAAWVSLVGVFGIWIIIRLRIKLHIVITGFILLFGLLFSLRTEIMMKLEQNQQTSSGEFAEHVQSITNVRNDASNLERLNRWNSAIRMWKEKPIFGWGPGTYMFKYAPFQVSHEKTSISTNMGTRGNAHSEYLGPLSESGFLGLISIVFIFLTTIFTGLRVYFTSKKREVRTLSLAILLGLITYYIHGIMNNFLDTDKISALVWGFTAILVAFDIYKGKGYGEKDVTPEVKYTPIL